MKNFEFFATEIARYIDPAKAQLLASGLAGSVVALIQKGTGAISFWDAFVRLTTGGSTAVFGVAAIKTFIPLTVEAASAFGFVLGMVAMQVTGGIINMANKFQANPEETIKRWKNK